MNPLCDVQELHLLMNLLSNLLCKLVSYTHDYSDYSIALNVFVSALNAIHYCIVMNRLHQLLKTSILVTELLVFHANLYGSFTLSENKRESEFYFFNLCSCSM